MILKKNFLPLDKFINKALYNSKNGFYMKNNPFGNKGDFITSPNISILFSEMLSIWTISFWKNLKCPKKVNLIELKSIISGSKLHKFTSDIEKEYEIRTS